MLVAMNPRCLFHPSDDNEFISKTKISNNFKMFLWTAASLKNNRRHLLLKLKLACATIEWICVVGCRIFRLVIFFLYIRKCVYSTSIFLYLVPDIRPDMNYGTSLEPSLAWIQFKNFPLLYRFFSKINKIYHNYVLKKST